MKTVAFWTPIDEPQKSNSLVYILEQSQPKRQPPTRFWDRTALRRIHFARAASDIGSCRTSTGNARRPRTLHNQ